MNEVKKKHTHTHTPENKNLGNNISTHILNAQRAAINKNTTTNGKMDKIISTYQSIHRKINVSGLKHEKAPSHTDREMEVNTMRSHFSSLI